MLRNDVGWVHTDLSCRHFVATSGLECNGIYTQNENERENKQYNCDRFWREDGIYPVTKALAKLANIALFVSELLAMDKKVTPDLIWKQECLASNVGQFARP